jgi:membrane associated rhomboid family serine protease
MAYSYRSYQSPTSIWVIIVLNLVLFMATMLFPELTRFLWLQPASFFSAPWTILTSMFAHSGFGHIFANMLTLFFFGTYLSRLVGEKRFLVVYFCGGILGGVFVILLAILGYLFSIHWLGSPLVPVVGASGAIYALGGALTVLMPRLRVFIFPLPVPLPLWAVVIGGFVILSFMPGIAWQAHLGGLVFGLLAGFFFRRKKGYPVY